MFLADLERRTGHRVEKLVEASLEKLAHLVLHARLHAPDIGQNVGAKAETMRKAAASQLNAMSGEQSLVLTAFRFGRPAADAAGNPRPFSFVSALLLAWRRQRSLDVLC